MKKFLIIFGSLSLVLIIAVSVFLAVLFTKGARLDNSSKKFASESLEKIVNPWSRQELLLRASPDFLISSGGKDRLDSFFDTLEQLGQYKEMDELVGQAMISYNLNEKKITAHYTTKARFENGEASFEIGLLQNSDIWYIQGFKVNSDVFFKKENQE